jgi:hypothetical protein
MKTGKNLIELATEIERRANSKRDFIVNTKDMLLGLTTDGANKFRHSLNFGDQGVFVNDIAHAQLAEHVDIPKAYYDRMRNEAQGLLCNNVNEWFRRYPAPRMVRTLDGVGRAFLSDKFRNTGMENEDLANALLPVIHELGLEVSSCEITDRRMYIKAVDPKVIRELAKVGARFGDGGHKIVRCASPAISIGNSEVGHGAWNVRGGYYDDFCSNLAFFGERSMRQAHVGGRQTIAEGELYALLSDRSKRLDSAALYSKLVDVVRGVFDQVKFNELIDKVEGSQADKITGDVVKVVEVTAQKIGLNQTEGKSVLRHLIEGGDLSRFGMLNAITRMSADVESYDRASELEVVGAKIIELPKDDWKVLAEAA